MRTRRLLLLAALTLAPLAGACTSSLTAPLDPPKTTSTDTTTLVSKEQNPWN
jgi:hypothetical protein